ncbi:hypothetical protein UFOVP80_63 [uncultured Caudovirales phage]|jgi:transcriptional regulator with XRE-family HTH domain|uniref:HTH_XRE domain containing protein n=1 Tax=uncultured Caudovirales phage TaxID=2100421 RepID=A0A6J5KWF0_9CAUD|nr:hypothetical protein UFOVP80_63 [uncultured Caudovirales phage]
MKFKRIEQALKDLEAITRNIEALSLSELLLLTRKALQVQRNIIAREMGLHTLTLHNLEMGKHSRIPSLPILQKITDYYGYDLDVLLQKAKEHELEKTEALNRSRAKLAKII